jgi:hypothetical protein
MLLPMVHGIWVRIGGVGLGAPVPAELDRLRRAEDGVVPHLHPSVSRITMPPSPLSTMRLSATTDLDDSSRKTGRPVLP